jgi:NAD(P)-dependent dehydrogenase (short-subunit alcohol dehydrogenase family)
MTAASDLFSLGGKVALVTGASRGLGAAMAVALASAGADVVLHGAERPPHATEAAIAGSTESRTALVTANLANRLETDALIPAAISAFGRLDILVNNAGIIHGADFLELAEADFDRVLRVNLKGAFLVGQAAARRMVAQVKAGKPPGAIINISSINAVVAIANHTPYCVSKGGIDQLTKVMALALAPYGIRVNAIGPGSIMTDILKAVATDKEAKRRILARTPLGRIGEPDEIASIAVFLASPEASYMTGETIYADGGRLALNYTVPVQDKALE